VERLALIQDCAARAFMLRLGDPSGLGLAMTALYVLVAVLFLALILRRRNWQAGEWRLWGAAAFVLVMLTLNKQLDLQQSIIWTGRCVARAEGWFDQRLIFQRAFGTAVLTLMALFAAWVLWAARGVLAQNRPLLLGLFLLALFVVWQVLRFEQMAGGIGQTVTRLRLHRLLEGAALATLGWAALQRLLGK